MHARPQRRSTDLLCELLDEGMVLYDRVTREAHALNEPATRVWSVANGTLTPVQIATAAGLGEAEAVAALDQLAARGLLVESSAASRGSMLTSSCTRRLGN